MAASLNKVLLMGNLTRDPDMRSLASGTSVCEFGLAINRRFISNGKPVEETCFVDIVVWGRSAELCRQYLQKGSLVLVEGRLKLDQWEDRNGGGKRSKLQVVAEQVQFMNANNRRDSDQQGGNSYGAPAQGGNSYGAPAQGGNSYGAPRPSMPRTAPASGNAAGQMPRQQPPMPPMPPASGAEGTSGAFNTEEGMEEYIPF